MNRALLLSHRLREVLLDGFWIANTNFLAQIQNTNWQQASHKILRLNTIALLTYHIHYYIGGINRVLDGGALDMKDQYSFDLPEIKSSMDWLNLVNSFATQANNLVLKVSNLSDSQLDAVFFDEKYGNYQRNIEGLIEHSYYHLGQISLIRKMIEAESGIFLS